MSFFISSLWILCLSTNYFSEFSNAFSCRWANAATGSSNFIGKESKLFQYGHGLIWWLRIFKRIMSTELIQFFFCLERVMFSEICWTFNANLKIMAWFKLLNKWISTNRQLSDPSYFWYKLYQHPRSSSFIFVIFLKVKYKTIGLGCLQDI